MSDDFLSADITDLLHGKPSTADAKDKDYEALLALDRRMMSGFSKTGRRRYSWPEPVRKRHLR